MADYLVTYKFIGLTREELDKLIDEIFEEMGIVPLRVEKVEEWLYISGNNIKTERLWKVYYLSCWWWRRSHPWFLRW